VRRGSGPRPARLSAASAAPSAALGNPELKAVTESIIDVGFRSPLVVKALEKLATEALSRKLPSSEPLEPSRKFISPASPVVDVSVLGASPSQASSPPVELPEAELVEAVAA